MQEKERKIEVGVHDAEYNISSMDPVLFEDPILLLEYLQNQDNTGKNIPSNDLKPDRQRMQISKSKGVPEVEKGDLSKFQTEKESPLSKVESVLRASKEELTLCDIQDRSGIADTNAIIDALGQLIVSETIERTWSRKKGAKSVYRTRVDYGLLGTELDKVQDNVSEGEIVEDKRNKNKHKKINSEVQTECLDDKSKLSIEKIQSEVLRVLGMARFPLDVSGIQVRSEHLKTIDIGYLKYVLLKLRQSHKIVEYYGNRGKTCLYSIK